MVSIILLDFAQIDSNWCWTPAHQHLGQMPVTSALLPRKALYQIISMDGFYSLRDLLIKSLFIDASAIVAGGRIAIILTSTATSTTT